MEDFEDPLDRLTHRDPLPKQAGVRVVVLAKEVTTTALGVAAALGKMLKARGRAWDARTIAPGESGLAAATAFALESSPMPLILITTALHPWTAEHLDPLLETIDKADHAVGRRRAGAGARARRWASTRAWSWLFAVPLTDVHTPIRLHRAEALRAIPGQSASGFWDVEWLAKATFLAQVVAVEEVPELAAWEPPTLGADARAVFRRPTFRHEVIPPTPDEA